MTVDIHTLVHHNLYGEGEVIKIADDNVYVLFGSKQRIFPYPEAFEKEYLVAGTSLENTVKLSDDAETLELTPDDIKHHIMVIKVNQLYEEDMAPDALYSIVRGIWKASIERAQRTEYVFGVYHSCIVAVYKPTEWFICKEAQDKLPRKDIVLSLKNENRIFFTDAAFEQGLPLDENQEFYLGKSIAKLTRIKNSQNPVSYLMPKDLRHTTVRGGSTKTKRETTKIFYDLTNEYGVLDHSKSDGVHDRFYLGKEGSGKALFLACSRAGWMCVYFDKEEKTFLENNGFICEEDTKSNWDYRTHVDAKDFDIFLKLVQDHLGR